jgi:Raf kinase inhibitor-like YbhB/YbcL family protein
MLTLHASSFAEGQEIPNRHGKRAQNVSPGLVWEDPPPGTESFALAVVDTDPGSRGYLHWLVVDIAPDTSELPEGAAQGPLPGGAQEASPYVGPFPPEGTHDYEFSLYALDTPQVELPPNPSLQQFLDAVEPHALTTATLVGAFTRD